jgi:hypothetical protein
MKDTVKVLFLTITAVAVTLFVLKSAYVSGEESARRRYQDSLNRTDDCQAAGRDRHDCRARFAPW